MKYILENEEQTMSDINNILPSHLDKASEEEKKIFFQTLLGLANADGHRDERETDFITEAAAAHGINDLESLSENLTIENIVENAKKIQNRPIAMELVKEMCMLSHVDNTLSDKETLYIGRVGLALGLELAKIEQISNWIIDHIIWLEQAKVIFEEE